MNVYKVAGFIANGSYREKVFAYEVEEKENCYIGDGRRIDKKKIGQVLDGYVKDGFEMYFLVQEDMDSVRSLVYRRCLSLARERFEQAKADFEGAAAFVFIAPSIIQSTNKGE